MIDGDDINYYRQREMRERELAAAAKDPKIGQIHMTMASRYASLLARLERYGVANG